jgi:Fe-S oxidoreductase
MSSSEATREVLWNISHGWVMYVLLVPTVAIGAYGIWRRYKSWTQGLPTEGRLDRPKERLIHLWNHALLQRRNLRQRYAGIFHAMIFWGFVTLTIATTVVMIDHDFGIPIMRGAFYLYFQSLFVDALGLLALIGVGMAGYRRWKTRPAKLVYTDEASWILIIGVIILATGFLLEGWRIVATADPWGAWSPIGYATGAVFAKFASIETLTQLHLWCWWFHLALVFGFLAWAPYTKMLHPLTSALNIYAANLEPIGGSLKSIDFETAKNFGVNSLKQFSWKDLLDLDACTECGRCTDACPANTVGKQLSPRDIILDLRGWLHKGTNEEFSLIGSSDALQSDRLFECTSCAACVEACPVSIEQLPKIVDMRRHQVMEEAEFPDTMQKAVNSMEERQHPYTGTQFSRTDWMKELDIPHASETEDAEVLVWAGCGTSLVERNQKSIRSLAQLLQKAGVKFSVLGRDEKCTGDVARRIGNEFLFESLAQENIDTFKKHKVKKVVTACPHCFNTFRNEYPQLGGDFETIHHSEFLGGLLKSGRLKVTEASERKITFHDPCYLSRHNGVTEEPRELLETTTQKTMTELPRNRQNSFCCGGGGGMSFVDEPSDKRVNHERAKEILATDADTVAVGCPFCTTMMEDGINANKGDRKIEVKELAELLNEATTAPDQP